MAAMEYQVGERSVQELHGSAIYESRTTNYAELVAGRMALEVKHLTDDEVEFDLRGVDVSFANALRRIMLSEVPTMAIETVYIEENDGVVMDEVLAHRLGLVPIAADPNDFEELHDPEDATDANTIVFGLEVRAPPNTRVSKTPSARVADRSPGEPAPHEDSDSEDDRLPGGPKHTTRVTTAHLSWLPQGEQEAFLADRPVQPVHDDILITKLRPGQAVALEAHGRKGIAKDHAKFSPVATASYRMFPKLATRPRKRSEPAHAFDGDAPPPPTSIFDAEGPVHVRSRPLPCSTCKLCAPRRDAAPPRDDRSEAFATRVALTRVSDHFLFKVESAGQLAPLRIVKDAIAVLKRKCDNWRTELDLVGAALSDAPPRGDGML
jgi:DNA-directed RNA polymerase I and III subunit RPAC1